MFSFYFFNFLKWEYHGKQPKVALAFICYNFEKIAQKLLFFQIIIFWKIEHFLSFIILAIFLYFTKKSSTDYFNFFNFFVIEVPNSPKKYFQMSC
jgi:hypothetical protein